MTLLAGLWSAAQQSAGGGGGFWDGGSIAAVIAALIALAGSAFTVYRQNQMAAAQRTHEMNIIAITQRFSDQQQRVSHRERQLSELYGPLRTYRRMSSALRTSLPPHPWRLVDNIAAVQGDQGQATVTAAILEINKATEDLLIHKAGLVEGEPPESFAVFMHHSRLLRAAWANKGELVHERAEGTRVADMPYPVQFSEDVEAAYERVRADLERLREGGQ